MRKQTRLLTIVSTLALAAFSHADIFAVTFGGTLINIDSATGNKTTIGNLGIASPNSLAMHGGSLLTTDNNKKLYSINRNTGAATFKCNIVAGSGDVRAMAGDSAGNLWVVTNESPTDKLWKVNASTGIGVLVGDTGLVTIQSLDSDSKGQLWAYDNDTKGLCRLNRLTGAAIDVSNFGVDNAMQSITFNNADEVFGGRDSLFSLNKTAGTSTLIGGSLNDVRGMEFDTNFTYYSSPSAAILRLGRLDAGNLGSLIEDDEDPVRICNFIVPNQVAPPVQLELVGEAPSTDLQSITFTMKHRMTSAGPFKCTFQMLNYESGRFVQIADLPVGTKYVEHTVGNVANPSNFVNSNKEVRVKYLVRPVGPIPANFWCHETDMAYWTIEPFIQ